MNENNEQNSGNVAPYKATGNLNTAIYNPSININDTMNVNIQNMATNELPVNNNQNEPQIQATNVQIPVNNNQTLNNITNSNTNQQVPNPDNGFVKKTYVTTDNKTKKKKNVTLNLGPEFKIALLIIVVLLVFVFLLPMITNVFNGY